jgi:hypothetical protein
MTELLPKELENKLWRMEKYRELLKDKNSLYLIQRPYNLPLNKLEEYIDKLHVKLLTDKKLTRDDRVFLNTLERVYKS